MTPTNKLDAALKRNKKRTVTWALNPCDVNTRCVGCTEMIKAGEPMAVKITKEGGRAILYQRFHRKSCDRKR